MQLMSIEDLAVYLGDSKRTIYKYIASGDCPPYIRISSKNIKFDRADVDAWLACTVTTLNVFHIPEFMKWKIKESGFKKINSGKRLPVLTIHVAHSPTTACIQTMPLEMKQLVREQYDNFKDWLINEELPDHVRAGAMTILNNIVNFMMRMSYQFIRKVLKTRFGWDWVIARFNPVQGI